MCCRMTEREVRLYQDIEQAATIKNMNNQDLKTLMAKGRKPIVDYTQDPGIRSKTTTSWIFRKSPKHNLY
ncbi:hypothetical protein G9P44_005135 [Scheffersomyces stipitis]|nr:hypothetical protein G9P44_005135 [Scheffersomyces stipitis]